MITNLHDMAELLQKPLSEQLRSMLGVLLKQKIAMGTTVLDLYQLHPSLAREFNAVGQMEIIFTTRQELPLAMLQLNLASGTVVLFRRAYSKTYQEEIWRPIVDATALVRFLNYVRSEKGVSKKGLLQRIIDHQIEMDS
jgi:hypothetical protein